MKKTIILSSAILGGVIATAYIIHKLIPRKWALIVADDFDLELGDQYPVYKK